MVDNVGGLGGLGGLDPSWLTNIYQQFTGRPADDAGAQYYQASGMDPYDIENTIASSPEAKGYETQKAIGLGLDPEWIDMLKNYGVNDLSAAPTDTPGQVRTDLTPLLSQKDVLDRMARGIYVEGSLGREGPDGELGIANSMFNRYMTNGTQIPNTQKFSPNMMGILNGSDYNGLLPQYQGKGVPEKLNAFKPGQADYDRIMQMLQDRINGKLGDNTNGATNYLNKDALTKNGDPIPAWAQGPKAFGNQQQIGNHTFMNQIPQDWYAPGNLPSWFKPQTPGTQPVDPNQFRGSLDPSSGASTSSIDAYNTQQNTNLANLNASFGNTGGGYTATPATMTTIGGYNGIYSPLINAGFNVGGGYSSGVSPTTNPLVVNPYFDGGMGQGTNLGVSQSTSPTIVGGGSTGSGTGIVTPNFGIGNGTGWMGLLNTLQGMEGGAGS